MSDNIKLIIEIPKEAKEYFDKPVSDDFKYSYYDHDGIIGKVIRNGTPLDSVKAEISKEYAKTHHIFLNYASGLDAALHIIDNCIGKSESEGK